MAGESQQLPHGQPDPSVLTTEQLERAVNSLRELMEARVDGMEREADEKFRSLDTQFDLVERQRVEQKTDTKDAVDAALAAAKEAVKEQTTAGDLAIDKSEKAQIKSVEALNDTFDTSFEAQRRDIDDLKGRVTIVESKKAGGEELRQQQGVTIGQGIAVAGVAMAGLGTVAAIVIVATSG